MNRRFMSALIGSTVAMVSAIAAGQTAGVAPAAATPDAGTSQLEEIVVTATKRPERVRDISGSVSAYDQAALESLGAESFSDYLTRTPGVVFNAGVPGNSPATIRGVATTTGIAQAQGTTGYFINDVPMTDPFYSAGIPDIDTFDVDNVAVLRGPQGTLFGSASMGGAVNYQAARPDLANFDAHFRGN
jgi:outer membrane receptor protein involved in Fe transport